MDLKAMDLSQVIHCLTWEKRHTTDTVPVIHRGTEDVEKGQETAKEPLEENKQICLITDH